MEYDALLKSKIDDLVERYRKGDRNAGAVLLHTFDPLLSRYLSLVTVGSFDPTDPIMSSHMSIISKDPIKAASLIRDRFKTMHVDEIIAEMHYCLLQAAISSNDVAGQFKISFMRKVVWFVSGEPVDLFEDYHEDVELNDLWVSGISASNGFEELSEGERHVLLLVYQEKMSDEELVHMLKSQDILIDIEDVEIIKTAAKDHLKRILDNRGYFS